MDKTVLQTIFESLPKGKDWQLSVMSIKTGGETAVPSYPSRFVTLEPEAAMTDYLNEIAENYIGEKRAGVSRLSNVSLYRGEWSSEHIFYLKTEDEKVQKTIRSFKNSDQRQEFLGHPNEIDPNAMVLQGEILIGDIMQPVWLLSTRKPMQKLSRRFRWIKGRKVYERVDEELLTLSKVIDAVVMDQFVFFLSVSGAQAFVCEKICREIAERKVERAKKITTNVERLKKVSLKGFNPRRYLSFNECRVNALAQSEELCVKVSGLFGIHFDHQSRKFSLQSDDEAERLIKVICDRGMEDPFSEKAVEVAWSGPWAKKGEGKK